MSGSSPTAVERFERGLRALGEPVEGCTIGLAVSGGPDSMALAALAKQWAARSGVKLAAAIVDHRLRAESSNEAQSVKDRLAKLGIPADILVWSGGSAVLSGKQEQARIARYGLLEDWARRAGILRVWLGHHADDQAETVAMRAEQGSGAQGLQGMNARRVERHCVFERPLLGFSKADLRAVCEAEGIDVVEDPSNLDLKSKRAQLRKQPLAPVPTVGSLNQQLEWPASLVADLRGFAWVRATDIRPEALRHVVAWVRGVHHAPTLEQSDKAVTILKDGRRSSLYGCVLDPRQDGWLLIAREARRSVVPFVKQGRVDDRWRLVSKDLVQPLVFNSDADFGDVKVPQRVLDAIPLPLGTRTAELTATGVRAGAFALEFNPRRSLLPTNVRASAAI